MTFIDITGGSPSPGLVAGYSILAVVSLACTGWAVHLGRTRLHYNASFSVRVLFPMATAILTLENIALAMSGLVYEELANDGVDNNYDSYLFIKAIFILQPFEVSLLLVVVFELTYLVHKSRSVNFCGMYFDEGRRVHNTAAMSCMLRNSIRLLATLLLIMGLLVNLDVIQDSATIDALVGRAGWHSYFTMEGNAKAKMHLLLSLLPVAILVLVCFYLSVMLWRYGTQSSMVVHSSMCNPWFFPLFGTIAMAVGQVFGPALYPVMSNAGILVFIITLLALMAEVDKDMVATHNVAGFLVQVAKIGDEISVTPRPRAQPSQRQAYHDQPNDTPYFRPPRPFRQSLKDEEKPDDQKEDGRKGQMSETRKPSSKSMHSESTEVTVPHSNVRKSIGSNKQKSFTNSSQNSSLFYDEDRIDAAQPSEASGANAKTASNPNSLNGASAESDRTGTSNFKNEEISQPPVEDDGQQTNLTVQEEMGVNISNQSEAIDEENGIITSKSIMKGLIEDVDVLIDEEIGIAGVVNDYSNDIDFSKKGIDESEIAISDEVNTSVISNELRASDASGSKNEEGVESSASSDQSDPNQSNLCSIPDKAVDDNYKSEAIEVESKP